MTKIQSIYAFVTMLVGIAVACFFVFRWVNDRESTDETVIKWMENQELVHEADESFKFQVMDGINTLVAKTDSALIIGRQNQQAIHANRYTIIQQIQKDTSLTRDEAFELLQPFLDGINDLKKNNGWEPYVDE